MADGKKLYLTELPDGTSKVHEMTEFTGDIAIGGFFVDENDPEGFNYFVQFIVTVCKGSVLEVKVSNVNKQPVCEYKAAVQDFQKNVSKAIKMSNSWWFKWLYRPWFLCVRFTGFSIIFVLKFLKDLTVWIVQKLTPL